MKRLVLCLLVLEHPILCNESVLLRIHCRVMKPWLNEPVNEASDGDRLHRELLSRCCQAPKGASLLWHSTSVLTSRRFAAGGLSEDTSPSALFIIASNVRGTGPPVASRNGMKREGNRTQIRFCSYFHRMEKRNWIMGSGTAWLLMRE
jgi:hypothetical protein